MGTPCVIALMASEMTLTVLTIFWKWILYSQLLNLKRSTRKSQLSFWMYLLQGTGDHISCTLFYLFLLYILHVIDYMRCESVTNKSNFAFIILNNNWTRFYWDDKTEKLQRKGQSFRLCIEIKSKQRLYRNALHRQSKVVHFLWPSSDLLRSRALQHLCCELAQNVFKNKLRQ